MRDTILTDAERQILDAIYRLEHIGVKGPEQGERPQRIRPVPVMLLRAVHHTGGVDVDAAIATLQTATMIEVAPLHAFPLRRGFRLPDGRTVELRAVKGDGTQADAGTLLAGNFAVVAVVDGVTVAGGAGPAGLGDAVTLTRDGLLTARRDDAGIRADPPAVQVEGGGPLEPPETTHIAPAARKAGEQYDRAAEALGDARPIDRDAYDALETIYQQRNRLSELPSFATWQRNLRRFRQATGRQKNLSRAGRIKRATSVVNQSNI